MYYYYIYFSSLLSLLINAPLLVFFCTIRFLYSYSGDFAVKREVVPKHEVKEMYEELVFEQDPLQVSRQGESAVRFLDGHYNEDLSCVMMTLQLGLGFLYLLRA